jgi:hypothetical protein
VCYARTRTWPGGCWVAIGTSAFILSSEPCKFRVIFRSMVQCQRKQQAIPQFLKLTYMDSRNSSDCVDKRCFSRFLEWRIYQVPIITSHNLTTYLLIIELRVPYDYDQRIPNVHQCRPTYVKRYPPITLSRMAPPRVCT